MRYRSVLAAAVPAALLIGGIGTASAAPTAGDGPTNRGQCVSESPKPTGKGGRSAVARSADPCAKPPLTCLETEDGGDKVTLDSGANTVTVSGSGPGSAGSNLECATSIPAIAGETVVTFDYTLADGTDPCGGGVPRIYVQIDGTYYNTIDGDPQCAQAVGNTVSFTVPVTGTIAAVGFVYDRGDTGSVTYSNTRIGSTLLDI